jgi:hypothetical protein
MLLYMISEVKTYIMFKLILYILFAIANANIYPILNCPITFFVISCSILILSLIKTNCIKNKQFLVILQSGDSNE